jgi:Asp/Glu/hydantoin racemase
MTPIPASNERLRLLFVNSNTNSEMTATLAAQAIAGREDMMDLTAVTPTFGAPYVESRADVVIAAHAILVAIAKAVRATPQRFDACVIACFGEPGLAAARELFDFPVVGLAEAAMHTAAQASTRFALLSRSDGWTAMLRELVTLYGFERQCAGVFSIQALREQGHQAPDDLVEAAGHYARQIKQLTGADGLILGGAALTGIAHRIQPQVSMTMIDALGSGIGQACHLARFGAGQPRPPSPLSEPPRAWLGVDADLAYFLK